MTRSPDLSVLILSLVSVICSAIRGETLDLIPPVPVLQSAELLSQRNEGKHTKSNDHHRSSQTTQRSTILNRKWQRGDEQDDQAANIDDGEEDYGLVSSQILVCNYGTDDGCDIAPELPEIL